MKPTHKEFEKWLAATREDDADLPPTMSRANPGDYLLLSVHLLWEAWQAAFAAGERAGMECAERACNSERLVDDTGEETDRAYNYAIDHCIAAIRAAIEK